MAKQDLLERTEMKMLKSMMRIKKIEKIRTEEIRAKAGAANISEKIREARCSNENMADGWNTETEVE